MAGQGARIMSEPIIIVGLARSGTTYLRVREALKEKESMCLK